MANEDNNNSVDQNSKVDTSFDEMSMDGQGFDTLEDAEDNSLVNDKDPLQEDAVQNANVQSTNRQFEQKTDDAQLQDPNDINDDYLVLEDDHEIEQVDDNVGVSFDNTTPAFTASQESADEEETRTDFVREVTEELPEITEEQTELDAATATDTSAPEDFITEITGTDQEDEDEDEEPEPIDVILDAQGRTLEIEFNNGVEDNRLELDINVTGSDSDGGSEVVVFTISNIPEGFSFEDVDGNDVGTQSGNSWNFNLNELDSLYAVPPEHYSGDSEWTFSVTVTETSSGDQVTTTETSNVHFEAVADAPTLSANDSAGMENTWIDVDISSTLVDQDGSETLAIYVADLPDGASFNAGTKLTQSLTLDDGTVLPAGTWQFEADDLDGLQVKQAINVSDDFDLRVYSQTTEGANNDTAVNGPESIHVDVGIVDPSVSGSGSGDERTWIELDLNAAINETDDTETMVVTLEDLPTGAELRYSDTQTVLTPNSDGKLIITDDLDNLEVRWGDSYTGQSDANITFDLRAVVTDVDAGTVSDTPLGDVVAPDTSEKVSAVTVEVDIVAGEAILSVSGSGTEDTAMPLDIDATLIDTDGSETITSYTITGVDDGFSFQDASGDPVGTKQSDGSWTFEPEDINGLHVNPPQHYSGDDTWNVSVHLEEKDGSTATVTQEFETYFEAVADEPTLSANDSAGMENTWIDVDISSSLVDQDGSETLAVYVADLPDSASFNAGTKLSESLTLGDGTVLPAGTWQFEADDLDGLQVKQATNVSDDFDLRIFSQTTEGANNDTAVNGPESIHVDVGIVDPTVSGSASGNEDSWIELDLNANVNAADGTETMAVYIENLPDGVEIRYIDSETALTKTDGRYEVTGNLDNIEVRWDQSTNQHSDVDFTFDLRAVVTDVDAGTASDTPLGDTVAPDTSESVTTVNVDVLAVADSANVSGSAVGVEDNWFDLDLNVSLIDTDGSESITSITLSGMPEGADLNQGTQVLDGNNQPTGEWTFTQAELVGLQIKPPLDSNDDFQLSLAVQTQEVADGDDVASKTKTTTKTIDVEVFGDADTPTVNVVDDTQTISEDTMFNLRTSIGDGFALDGDLTEDGSSDRATSQDSSETLTFRITPQESGTRLAISDDATIGDDEYIDLPAEGYWTVSAQDVFDGKVYVGGAENWSSENGSSDSIHFDILSVSTENDANADDSALGGSGLTRSGVAISEADTLTLVIGADVDGTVISGSDSGLEDQSGGIPYEPKITMIDADGSEEFTGNVILTSSDSDMISGHLELNGVQINPTDDGNGNYTWEIPVENLETTGTTGEFRLRNVDFFPEEHNSNDISLKITVTTMESSTGETRDTTSNGYITVRAVADAPSLAIGEAGARDIVTGLEDNYIDLGLDAQLVDTDGSEYISKLRLYDVPDGWEVGYLDDDDNFTLASDKGSYWNLSEAKLDQVVLNPPANTHEETGIDLRFKVWSQESENGNWQVKTRESSTTQEFTVKVTADADTPSVITKNASGYEDTHIELDIRSSLGSDTDGSESLSLLLGNIPDGSAFYDGDGNAIGQKVTINGDGSLTADANGDYWLFENDQWDDIFIAPPEDSNEDFDIAVTVRSTEASNGDFEVATATINVDVIGVADAPEVGSDPNQPIVLNGHEDTELDPNLSQFATKDDDGSESMSLVISDIPSGVDVYMSSGNEDYMSYLGNGKWSVDADYIDEVRISTSKDFAGTKDMTIKFISTENDGDMYAVSRTVQLNIEAEADQPIASISGSIVEDTSSVELSIKAKPSDLTSESPEEITQIIINIDEDDVPSGTELELVYDGQTYQVSAGADDLVINVDENTAGYNASTGELSGVVLQGIPEDWSKNIGVTMNVTSEDIDGSTATKTVNSSVNITAEADTLSTFSISSTVNATAGDTSSLGLNVVLGDTDGSEEAYLIVEDVPNGASLNIGFSAGNGVWIVPSNEDLNSLSFTSDYSGSATLKVRAIITDTDPDGGQDTHEMDPITVDISYAAGSGGASDWSATTPTAAPNASSTITANEDQSFDLSGLTMTLNEPGAVASAIVISNLPAGSSISGAYQNPVDGSWVVAYDERDSVTIKGPSDFSGDLEADISVISIADGVYGQSSSATMVIADIAPVTDGGQFIGGAVSGSTLTEDAGAIDLELTLTPLDVDLSEKMSSDQVIISNVPDGAILYLDNIALTDDGSGNYVISVDSIDGISSIDIDGLSIKPPANYDGTMSLSLEAEFIDQTGAVKTVTGNLNVEIEAVADQAQLSAGNVNGSEDQLIELDLQAFNPDMAGDYASEKMSVVIGDVPDGAVIKGASNNGDGTWTVKKSNIDFDTGEISNVSILPPRDFSGNFDLELKAFSIEGSNDDVAVNSINFSVDVAGVADTPDIDPSAVTGNEDTEIGLTLNEQLADSSETLLVTISDVPEGASFTDGNGNPIGVEVQIDENSRPVLDGNNEPVAVSGTSSGAWYFTAAQVGAGISFVAAAHASGEFTMHAVATAVDDGNVAHSLLEDFIVTVDGVADTPTLSIGDLSGALDAFHAVGDEDQSGGIAIDINAALIDTDGSETLQVIITGGPDGTTFVSGSDTIEANGSGQWIVEASQLDNLKVVTPENYNGNFQLGVEAVASENATTANQTATLDVNVEAVNDAPELTLNSTDQGASGAINDPIMVIPHDSDTPNLLGISDADGTELTGMNIQITNGADIGDSLGLNGVEIGLGNSGDFIISGTDITVSYDQATSTLSLQGTADYDTYTDLAESIVFTNSTGQFEGGERSFEITAYDESGATGTISTTSTISDSGVTLNPSAAPDVQWGMNGVSMKGGDGDEQFVINFGDVNSVDGGLGMDTLYLRGSAGDDGDWLVSIDENDGSVRLTSEDDPELSGLVSLDNGSVNEAASDANNLVFEGDASGSIEFDNGEVIEFDNFDKMSF